MFRQWVASSPVLLITTPQLHLHAVCFALVGEPPSVKSYSPMEQSGPIQLGSQLHSPVSGMKAPCPWHWSGHWALGSSQWSPPQPGLQWHSPFTQMPFLEHDGSRQSTVLSKRYTKANKHHREKQNEGVIIAADVKSKLNIVSYKEKDVTKNTFLFFVHIKR